MQSFQLDPGKEFNVLKSTKRSQAATMVLAAGDKTGGPDNKHENSDQWLYVMSGSGKAIIKGEEHELKPKLLLLIEAGETHEIINTGPEELVTLNFYAPPYY